MLTVIPKNDAEYNTDLTVSCRVLLPRKLHSFLLPYTTVKWSTPPGTYFTTDEVKDHGTFLSHNLAILSVNETHNGVYVCSVVIHLPNISFLISNEMQYTLNAKGKIWENSLKIIYCSYSLHSALRISTDHNLIIGIPSEVLCRSSVLQIEIMTLSNNNKTLAVANDTNLIAVSFVPDHS